MSDHTKGPWTALRKSSIRACCTIVDEQGFDVATVNPFVAPFDSKEDEANARLIAAAPDLLEALEALMSNDHIDLGDLIYKVREAEGFGWEGPSVRAWSEAVTLAKVAIKKAKGGAE